MLSYGITDVGKRRAANQDSFIIDQRAPSTLLAVVCDGMGGAAGGLEASSIACSVFSDSVEADLASLEERAKPLTPALCERVLRRGVDFANDAVSRRAAEDPGLSGMGTTLVAALVSEGRIYVVNVGDSRLYALKGGVAEQITHDHSYVQLLVDVGRLTPEQAKKSANRNIITRAVGTCESVECDVFTIDTLPDAILLCSDGLTNMLSAEDIGSRFGSVPTSEEDVASVCRSLIDGANENGGLDNITAAVVVFGGSTAELEDSGQLTIDAARIESECPSHECGVSVREDDVSAQECVAPAQKCVASAQAEAGNVSGSLGDVAEALPAQEHVAGAKSEDKRKG